MGALVNDIGAWVAIFVGITVIIGGLYGFGVWVRRSLRHVITEDVAPALAHLHKCMENLGKEASANALTAARQAREAREQAAEARSQASQARDAVLEHAAIMRTHIEQDEASFAAITAWRAAVDDWRAGTDIALRNIQQAQVPLVEEPAVGRLR